MADTDKRSLVAEAALARKRIRRFHEEIKSKTYFELFGVTSTDTDLTKIKTMYKDLAKQWHIDAYAGLELGAEKPLLNEVFSHITEAYETLLEPAKRSEYALRLQREAKGLATDVSAVLRAEQLFDEALAEIRRKRWDEAVRGLEEAIRLNGDDPLYRAQLGWAEFNQSARNRSAAQRAIDRVMGAVQRQENLPIAYQYLGQMYFTLENYAEAKKWWKKCLDWDSKNIEASRGLRLVNQREEKNKGGLGGFIQKLLNKR
ncbi:MAG: tetratricopeptide repeat protein [Deltaproteobacteria bacterium]|nr:tetratricopeptide repeat protein [Deltaproteobacteria bacterium]